ncbi:DUF4097 family beta strand repeat-containing protein [Streptomyces sp. NPDC020965]|uniref:DUF4097 family beta strand repeat-containing protein n=1 Tax=Streptomyces sp. NPDC020965 TaxID=3365105 RepID=UPI00379E3D05
MRQQQRRYLAIYAAASISVGGLSACNLTKGETFEDDTTLSGKVTSVRIENGSGGVTLRGTEGGGALALERSIEYKDDKPSGETHRVEDGVLVLGGCGSRCSVRYTVDVPVGVGVSGKTSSGAVRLSKVGAVKVSTNSGRIEMDGVSGSVDVRTSNGRITGRGLAGREIEAETSNGAIELTPKTPQSIRAKTSNGDITLTLPAAQYQVSADSNNGDKNIGITHDPGGEFRLGLTSGNGDITVKTA